MLQPQGYSTRKMRPRKKIWRETEAIWSCGNWNRTSQASGSFFMSKLAEMLRTPTNWARKWLAVREQAILWCRFRPNRFPARIRVPLGRINLLMRAIQLARGVLSAHMFAERIRATAIFLSGASAHFENLSLCWVSVQRDSTMI